MTVNDLPIVIDGPGDYETRDKRRATICEVRDDTCTAYGTLHLNKPWAADPATTWHVSGRHYPHPHLSGKDIMRKL